MRTRIITTTRRKKRGEEEEVIIVRSQTVGQKQKSGILLSCGTIKEKFEVLFKAYGNESSTMIKKEIFESILTDCYLVSISYLPRLVDDSIADLKEPISIYLYMLHRYSHYSYEAIFDALMWKNDQIDINVFYETIFQKYYYLSSSTGIRRELYRLSKLHIDE